MSSLRGMDSFVKLKFQSEQAELRFRPPQGERWNEGMNGGPCVRLFNSPPPGFDIRQLMDTRTCFQNTKDL